MGDAALNAIPAFPEHAPLEQLMTIPSVLIATDVMGLLWQLARL